MFVRELDNTHLPKISTNIAYCNEDIHKKYFQCKEGDESKWHCAFFKDLRNDRRSSWKYPLLVLYGCFYNNVRNQTNTRMQWISLDFNRILNAFQYRLTLTISIMITINIIKPNRAIFSYGAWKATGSGTKISFEVSLGFTHILMPMTSPHKEFRFLLLIYREFESSSRRYYLC